MKTLNALALIAAIGLAVPAYAQTPADVRNGRVDMHSDKMDFNHREVKLDRQKGKEMSADAKEEGAMEGKSKKHGKKHGKKHHKKHGKKHHAKKAAEAEAKKDGK